MSPESHTMRIKEEQRNHSERYHPEERWAQGIRKQQIQGHGSFGKGQ